MLQVEVYMAQQLNYNVDIGTSNILNRVLTATGIDNLTRSSILRNLAEAMASDVSFVLGNVDSSTAQFYSQTATGSFLDAKGFDIGVSRNIADSIQIYASDQAIQIVPLIQGDTFGTYLSGAELTINEGDLLATVSAKYEFTALETITLNSGDTSAYLSVNINPVDITNFTSGTLSLTQGQQIQIDGSSPLGQITSNLTLVATQPISIETSNETDDQLRARVISGLAAPIKGTTDTIGNILAEIPQLLGYSLQQNVRNENSLDIFIVTQSLIDATNFSYIPNYILNLARSNFPIGTDITVQFPSQLQIFVQYRTDPDEVIPDATIQDVIQQVFNGNFVYSQANIITKDDFETLVEAALPNLISFEITLLQAFDPVVSAYVFTTNGDLFIPTAYYSYISALTNITKIS